MNCCEWVANTLILLEFAYGGRYHSGRHWGVAARIAQAGAASTDLGTAGTPAGPWRGQSFDGPGETFGTTSRLRERTGLVRALGSPAPCGALVEAFLVSTGLVTIAEIGDKTQLLALVLAARFRRPWPIALGILLATLANHAAAALIGSVAGDLLQGPALRWILGLSFLAVAVWALIPDKLGDGEGSRARHAGAFLTTLIGFFLVEIGDKTQIATIALAATYEALPAVVLGTTLGMMIANLPVVLAGEALARHLPLRLIRALAAASFAILGLLILSGAMTWSST